MRTWIVAMLLALPALALGEDQAPAAGGDAAASAPAEGAINVVGLKIGTGIQDKELQGEAETFAPEVGKVWCWAKTSGGQGSDLTYAWYRGDQKVSEVKVALKFASMRSWSYKTIPADGKGAWRVDLVGPDGAVLKSAAFTIGE